MERLTKSVVVLVSGSGTTFEALALGLKGSEIEIKALIASRAGIGAISKAETLGVQSKVHDENNLQEIIDSYEPDLIVLAGYLKKLDVNLVKYFESKIINVHPSLLPKYGGKGMYGRKVHEAVKAAGDSESGATVHWVTENYDEGPVISQTIVSIHQNDDVDTIESKVRAAEKDLLVTTVKGLL